MRNLRQSIVTMAMMMVTGATAWAAENPRTIAWQGVDRSGQKVTVPVPDRPTVVAFVRAGQGQSQDVLKRVAAAVGTPPVAQVVVIVSGRDAAEQGKAFAVAEGPGAGWPVVTDPAFAASGEMGVHVWPTTLVVRPDGTELAHLAGVPGHFAVHLEAYLAHAAGKLDAAGLQSRLQARVVVADGSEQKAGRHLKLAEKLLEQGRAESAAAELDAVIQLNPQDPKMRVSLARALAVGGRAAEALAVVNDLPANQVPAFQLNLVRGRALLELGKWAEAKAALAEAVKMNPDPAEAHYLLGVVHQQGGDMVAAAAEFRAAFEGVDAARGKIIKGK